MSFLLFAQIAFLIILFVALSTLAALKLSQIFWDKALTYQQDLISSFGDDDDVDVPLFPQDDRINPPIGDSPFRS